MDPGGPRTAHPKRMDRGWNKGRSWGDPGLPHPAAFPLSTPISASSRGRSGQASHRHIPSCRSREGSGPWAAGVRAPLCPWGAALGCDTQPHSTPSTAGRCNGCVLVPRGVGRGGLGHGDGAGGLLQVEVGQCCRVHPAQRGDGEGSVCSDGAPRARVCMHGGTNSCRASIRGAAPLLWAWGPAMSCIPLPG